MARAGMGGPVFQEGPAPRLKDFSDMTCGTKWCSHVVSAPTVHLAVLTDPRDSAVSAGPCRRYLVWTFPHSHFIVCFPIPGEWAGWRLAAAAATSSCRAFSPGR